MVIGLKLFLLCGLLSNLSKVSNFLRCLQTFQIEKLHSFEISLLVNQRKGEQVIEAPCSQRIEWVRWLKTGFYDALQQILVHVWL